MEATVYSEGVESFVGLEPPVVHHPPTSSDEAPQAHDQNPVNLINLTHATAHPLKTLKIQYVNALPEYPETHPGGYTYIVHAPGLTSHEVDSAIYEDIHGTFLQTLSNKHKYRCSGVKICENVSQDIRSLHHTQVTEDIWNVVREGRKDLEPVEKDIPVRDAFRLYRSIDSLFQNKRACQDPQDTCRPKFYELAQDETSISLPCVTCVNSTAENYGQHFSKTLEGVDHINFNYLGQVFQQKVSVEPGDCGILANVAARRKTCGYNHPDGSGNLQIVPCEVIFHFIIPLDFEACPYVIFTSHGTHTHPPPMPSKTAQAIMKGILDIARDTRDSDKKLSMFTNSPELDHFCQQYDGQNMLDVHESFANLDKVDAIMKKQQLLSHPAGQEFNNLLFECQRNEQLKAYILRIFRDSNGKMLICAFRDQLEALMSVDSFGIDMSCTRVKLCSMKEVIFTACIPQGGKAITLLRVFTEQDSTKGYHLLFKRVFTLIQEVLEQEILFHPVHGAGFRAFVVDMDTKQMTGLGLYLQERDLKHRQWQWQLRSIIVFSKPHFFRAIEEALGTGTREEGLHTEMSQLLDCGSSNEYLGLCNKLMQNESSSVRQWATHKSNTVIAAGVNKHFSFIPSDLYDLFPRDHTNSTTLAQNPSRPTQGHSPLTAAIICGLHIDRDAMNRAQARRMGGVYSARKEMANGRYQQPRPLSLEETRKRKRNSEFSSSREGRDITLHAQTTTPQASTPRIHTPQNSTHQSFARPQSQVGTQASRLSSPPNLSEIITPSQSATRNTAPTASELTLRRQDLELKKEELQLRSESLALGQREQELRKLELENEKTELELMKLRRQLTEAAAES